MTEDLGVESHKEKIDWWGITEEELSHYPRLSKQFTRLFPPGIKEICCLCKTRNANVKWSDESILCKSCTWQFLVGKILRFHQEMPDSYDPHNLYHKTYPYYPKDK